MRDFLYWVIDGITMLHRTFLQLNNRYGWSLNDKQLHFYIFGFGCFIIFLLVHYIFVRLSKISIMAISWIYTFTIAIVLAFAIELGQRQTGTGSLDFLDIVYGINGFLFFFAIFIFLNILVSSIRKYIKYRLKVNRSKL